VQPTCSQSPSGSENRAGEIFGPVLVAQTFKDLDEAMELANGTDYGLGASFWSTNPASIQHAAETIEAGTVWINTHGALDPSIPFGGFKRSGIGRSWARSRSSTTPRLNRSSCGSEPMNRSISP